MFPIRSFIACAGILLVRCLNIPFALFLGATIAVPVAAQAAEISLSPSISLIQTYAGVIVDAALTVVIGWALRWLHLAGNKQALDAAAQLRAFVHQTIDRGIERAVATLPQGAKVIDVQSDIIAAAVIYAQSQAPDALKRLGAGPFELQRLIEAKLAERTTAGILDLGRPSPGFGIA